MTALAYFFGNCYVISDAQKLFVIFMGHAVAQLVEALRYKPEGRGFDSRLEFFIDIILPVALWQWG